MTASDNLPPVAKTGAKGRGGSPRAAARIAAVQALYQIDMSGLPADQVIAEFREHRLGSDTDAELFSAITAAASVRRAEIDELIRAVLEGWTLERLDSVLRAVLRAGVCELLDFADVPTRVVIDQYLEVAHAFLGAKESGLVNGVLDRLARRLRPDDVKALPAHGAPESKKTR